MTLYEVIILISWLAFIFYWGFSALSAKRNTNKLSRYFGWRIVVVLILVALARLNIFRLTLSDLNYHGGVNPLLALVGVVLCVCGIAFAIWARYHLGRNWGMPMSVKENPELVTTGPYTYVRHPIYTGVIFAMLGSALAANTAYFFIFIFATLYFIVSARSEEKLMLKQFGAQYSEYMKRTKMLIPFIF